MEKISVLNCETCGAPLKFSDGGLSAACPYCGNVYRFAGGKSEALTLALNRANALRIGCDFDGAIREYRLITEHNPEDAEAYWGLALSTYGIEYVSDTRTEKRIPTCRRTVKKSILEDENYLNAVKYADAEQAEVYRSRALVIDKLQRGIKHRMEEGEDFDVFLSFRSSDGGGAPTRERTVARRIYDEFTRRGIKTFFSEVTLKEKPGEDYEPVIYKALYSCKFFILIAFSEENVNAPWVKNEWSRFRDRVKEEHLSGACCAVFDTDSVSALPPFIRSQQGVNISKYPAGGYEIELADNLQVRLSRKKMRSRNDAAGMYPGGSEAASLAVRALVRSADIDLGDEVYEAAAEKYLRVLDMDAECGRAWWGLFLAKNGASAAGLAAQNMTYKQALSFKDDRNLKNAERFGDEELKEKVSAFRKMCLFRGRELANDCDVGIKAEQKNLEDMRDRRKKECAKHKSSLHKAERAQKAAKVDPRIVKRGMLPLTIVYLVLFSIIYSATGKEVLLYIGFGTAAVILVSGVFVYFMLKSKVKKSEADYHADKDEADRLERLIKGLDEEISSSEEKIKQLKTMAAAYRNVF